MSIRATTIKLAQRATLKALGEPTQYTAGAVTLEVVGIFNAPYEQVNTGRAGVQSAMPTVFYRLEDLPSDPQEVPPSIVIRGIAYGVSEVKPDGQGGVMLHLHRS